MEPARKPGDPLTGVLDGYFEVRDGEFIVGGVHVSDLVESHGSPQFVYDKGVILQKTREVRAILPDRFQLFYSMKANPNAAILDCFLSEGCGLEIASGGELYQALAAGCPADRIVFAGPGKRENELEAAVESAIREIHVESIEEIRSLDAIAMRRGRVCRVALRVNPVGASGGAMRMGGTASPFGIDEEELDAAIDAALTCQHLKICGVHLFMATQILDAETLIGQYRCAIEIAQRMAPRIGPLETIDFGGGWGTPYFAHEQELDLGAVEHGLAAIDRELAADPLLTGASAILEPGRFLINEAGVYLARVIRTKRSRGKVFAVLDGGMHHHLAASGNLGQAMKRNYPLAIVNKLDEPVAEPVEIVGPLCTPLDRIGRSVQLPTIETGDIVGVFLSGAYGRTSSPLGFLSHDAPPEIMAWQGETKVIRRRGEPLDHLRDQAENGKKSNDAHGCRHMTAILAPRPVPTSRPKKAAGTVELVKIRSALFPRLYEAFLHDDDPLSDESDWRNVFDYQWETDEDHTGYALLRDGEVIGMMAMAFSNRFIDGERHEFCNLHTWWVHPDHRGHSTAMLRPILGLKDYTITHFTPCERVRALLKRLGFVDLNIQMKLLLPLWPFSKSRLRSAAQITFDAAIDLSLLDDEERRLLVDHRPYRMGSLLLQEEGEHCAVLYTCVERYRVRYCHIHFISAKAVFARHEEAVRTALMQRHGVRLVVLDTRLVQDLSLRRSVNFWAPAHAVYQPAGGVSPAQVDNLYTDVVMLRLAMMPHLSHEIGEIVRRWLPTKKGSST